MSTPIFVLLAVAAVWTLIYTGVRLVAWIATVAALLLLGRTTGAIGVNAFLAMSASFAVVAALLGIAPLRRALISGPVFGGFKKVLPEMSSTEREALEAGDVWWEADMFRGRPRWNKLLSFKYTALTADEQSYLDNEVETVCRMVDDWKVEFEDKDLPPEVWQYLKDNKFFAMLIKKEYGGLGFSAVAQSCVVTKLASKSTTLAVTVMVPNSLGPG
jgi:acyl-CoA dehydrogenase